MDYDQLKGKEPIMETIPEAMEEDPESIDLEGLDLAGLEEACTKRDYTSIPEQQIEKMEEILARAQQIPSLGIQGGTIINTQYFSKESLKRGRKTSLQ